MKACSTTRFSDWLSAGCAEDPATHVHLDLLGLRFGLLVQVQLQNAVGVAGVDVFSVHCRGKRERTEKRPVTALDAMEVLFLLELALALHGKRVVLHAHVQVFFLDARNFQLQYDALLVLIDVDRGQYKAGSRQGAVSFAHLRTGGYAALQDCDFTERIPTSDCHFDVSPNA